VVGEAADGQQLLAVVDQTRPDVVLTDPAMPGLDGATATQRLLDRHPQLGVLALTMHDDDQALFGALRAGARGYLLKGADKAEILRAVQPSPPAKRSMAPLWRGESWSSSPARSSGTPPRSFPS
jgi:DNA-binding NarL/FixJ family response regulator